MDKDGIRVGIHNFFVGLALVPVILCKFIATWLSANSAVNRASGIFRRKLAKLGISEEKCKMLAKEYASAKDYIFEGFLKTKNDVQTSCSKKSGGFRNVFIKILPGGQIFLRLRNGQTKGVASAIFLDATKIIILAVGLSRALERDVYWVGVCIVSYVLYSSLFGLASELIDRSQNSKKGLLGSAINIIGEALSDTKVIAIVGLALSSHAILGAPFVPLYHVVPNIDFVEHYISGFGIGLFTVKAYRTFTSHISYSKALTTLGSAELSNQISLFEEASAELPFICYSTVFVGLIWEGLEEIAKNFTPRVINVFFWNGVADIIMALLGALTAYILVSYSFIIKRRENCSNGNAEKAKVDPKAVWKASDVVLSRMKDAISIVYSENPGEDLSRGVQRS